MRVPMVYLAAVAAAAMSASATSSTFEKMPFKCAVGGEAFTALVQMSMSSFGQRPDGHGYHTGVAPPVECPGNGLIHYKDEFSAAEVARLTPLVMGADYQALRKTDTAEYRLYWLMQRMAEPAEQVTGALLAATWSSDGDAERKARYQRAYVANATALPGTEGDALWLKLRAANALRELGQHRESNELLASLRPRVAALDEAEERKWGGKLVDDLLTLNAEANRSSEPLILVPDMIAATECAKPSRAWTNSDTAICAQPEIKRLIEQRKSIGDDE